MTQDTSAADGGTPLPDGDSSDRASSPRAAASAAPTGLAPMDTLPPFPQPRAPEPPRPRKQFRPPLWLVGAGMLALGLLIGVTVMRQRARTQTIIVSVNGENITRDDLFNQMQDVYGAQTMHKMVQNMLQLQFARKKNLAPSEGDVEKEYAKLKKRPNFSQALAQSGMLEGDFKQNLRVQLAETNVITQGVTATDTDAQAYYRAQSSPGNPSAQFYRPAAVSLRAIATATEPQARQALAELSGQTPFELVATTYSVDTSKTNGGLLAPLSFGRSPLHRSPPLEASVFAMKVGDQLGPVFFANQWWIFRCQDKAAAVTVPYADVQEQCLTGAKLIKGTALNSKRIQQEFADFQHTSNLQAFWPQYQKVVAAH